MMSVEPRAWLRDAGWLRSKLHDEGLSSAEVAAELGVAKGAVGYWRAQHGIGALTAIERIERQIGVALPDETADPVAWVRCRHVTEGWSWPHISAALNARVSPRRLRRLAEAHGFARSHPSGPEVAPTAREWLADREWLTRRYHHAGATLREIGAELGVSMRTVERALRQAGVTRRRRGPRTQSQLSS